MEHHFHPWNGTSAHKHLSVIGMVEGSPSTAYVRVLGDHEEDGSHPMHEHEAVHAIWVKDEEGKIVHLTEFDDKYVCTISHTYVAPHLPHHCADACSFSLSAYFLYWRSHEEDQKAHTEFDVKAYQTALDGGASARSAPKLTPYALCYNHGTLSIWEGRPFKLPPLPIKEEL